MNQLATQDALSQQSILVIDDCTDALYLGRYLLEKDGFKVFTASSGAEAFQILEKIQKPSLILLDMQMADMSGDFFLETLDKIKPNFLSHVPVVFYSGEDAITLNKATGFIRKAGDINQFLKQVHSYLKPDTKVH